MAPHSSPSAIDVTSPHIRSSEGGNEATSSPRWRPTEKQKRILEELFAAGLCNPIPEDVSDIVALLKLYGEVQEKSVFYWFRNSRSRNRRKGQKISIQESSSQHEKEITELSLGRACTPSIPVNSISTESSVDQAQFSAEEEEASRIEGELISLIVRQHLERKKPKPLNSSSSNAPIPGRNIISETSMNIGLAISTEYEKRGELLELFPLPPEGTSDHQR